MRRPIRAAMYLAALAAISGRLTAGPKEYNNPEFGIRLAVPSEGSLCSTSSDEHDHGFGILLGGGSAKDCHDDVRHRSIWLFAFFNVLDDTKRLPGLLKMGCEVAGGRCQPGPTDLHVASLASVTGMVKLPDGWVVIIFATQAGAPDTFEPSEPSVDYLFSLRTRPEYMDQDLHVFRKLLQAVRLSSGGK